MRGSLSVTSSVWSSSASARSMSSSRKAVAVDSRRARSQVSTKSCAVTGSPSLQRAVRADLEQVAEAVRRDAEVLGQRRHHVQLAVDHQQPVEHVRGERVGVADVLEAGRDLARLRQRRHQPLDRQRLLHRHHLAGEGLVVGRLGGRVVEGEMVHQRDLEQRLARAAVIAHRLQEGAGVAVVMDRLGVGGDRARLVAGPDQVVGRPLGIAGLAEVAGQVCQRARAQTLGLGQLLERQSDLDGAAAFGAPR